MNLLVNLATLVDQLDPDVTAFLDLFRDGRVPLRLSLAIVAAAAILLAILTAWGAAALARLHMLRRRLRGFGTGRAFKAQYREVDAALSNSLLGRAWAEYRECLRMGEDSVLYLRRPEEYFGPHAISGMSFPARFFAAVHGYFVGIGLLLTFIGLVAALKFASSGVSSTNITVAKEALSALLSAASFKFMTSIAGLGCSLVLSVAARIMTYLIEGAIGGVAGDLDRSMDPIVAERLAYDQLSLNRAQLAELEKIGTRLDANASHAEKRASGGASDQETLKQVLASFLAEMRGSAGSEMKQLAAKLSDVGGAIGRMQTHIGASGQQFADQMSLAASRLLNAATALQNSVDARANKVGDKIDALAESLAKGEALFADTADKAARGMARTLKGASDELAFGVVQAAMGLVQTSDGLAQRLGGVLGGFDALDGKIQAQVAGMTKIVAELDGAAKTLQESAGSWMRSAAPIAASVEGSRQAASELGKVVDRVAAAQIDMANMAKAVSELSDKASSVWENYRVRFEKVDAELQTVFDRLNGGTRAFGKEVMEFVGKLDKSLADGMHALSVGTEELREVAEILVLDVNAKAA